MSLPHPPAPTTGREPVARGGGARPARRFAELLAVATLGVAQPLFDLLGREPAFFVAHRAGRVDLLMFVLLPTVGLAGLLVAVEAAAGRLSKRSLVPPLHAALVGLLALPLGLLVARRLPALPVAVAAALAVAAGVAVAWLTRTRAGATLLATAGVLAALLPLHFLFVSPARRLVLPGGRAAGDEVPALRAPREVPVVVVVFDELPLASLLDGEGRIARRRFPAFAALAESATWYRWATSVSATTQHAVPALLTGAYPIPGSLPVLADHPRNLFTMLAGSHQVRAFESLTRLCPPEVCADAEPLPPAIARLRALLADAAVVYLHLLAPPPLASHLPPVGGTWGDFAGAPAADLDGRRRRDIPRQVATFLAGLAAADEQRPGLHYLHIELPHIPWRYLPSGREYGPISTSFFAHGVAEDTTWRPDDWLVAQGLQRHLLQLAYGDRVLGQVLSTLAARSWATRALLVVTADHGLSFQVGEPGRELTPGNFAEVLAVPLFVRLPGQTLGASSELPARIVDVLPTIAEVAGFAPMPWPMDGVSLLRSGGPPAQRELLAHAPGIHTPAVRGLHRFPAEQLPAAERAAVERIVRWFGDDLPAGELFALARRPELSGRPVSELPRTPRAGAGVALEQPWFFDRVRPDGRFLPAQVVGRLLPLPGEELVDQSELAVALNGVVRATTRSFRDGRGVRFSAMLPEQGFVAGRNVVEVFLVAPDGRLSATVDRSGPRYHLRRDAGGAITGIAATNGTSCTLDPRAVDGGLLYEDWYVSGWAAAADRRYTFVVVMVFLGEELVRTVPTSGGPPAGSLAAGRPGLERSGFRFIVPESVRSDTGNEALRVFAAAGERCSELGFEATVHADMPTPVESERLGPTGSR